MAAVAVAAPSYPIPGYDGPNASKPFSIANFTSKVLLNGKEIKEAGNAGMDGLVTIEADDVVTTFVKNTSYKVPTGVTSIHVCLWGAGGGNLSPGPAPTSGPVGGGGAYVEGDLAVTPGEVLQVFVGEAGKPRSGNSGTRSNGGGGAPMNNSAGGGGRSALQRGPVDSCQDIVTAGGGGGAGAVFSGGAATIEKVSYSGGGSLSGPGSSASGLPRAKNDPSVPNRSAKCIDSSSNGAGGDNTKATNSAGGLSPTDCLKGGGDSDGNQGGDKQTAKTPPKAPAPETDPVTQKSTTAHDGYYGAGGGGGYKGGGGGSDVGGGGGGAGSSYLDALTGTGNSKSAGVKTSGDMTATGLGGNPKVTDVTLPYVPPKIGTTPCFQFGVADCNGKLRKYTKKECSALGGTFVNGICYSGTATTVGSDAFDWKCSFLNSATTTVRPVTDPQVARRAEGRGATTPVTTTVRPVTSTVRPVTTTVRPVTTTVRALRGGSRRRTRNNGRSKKMKRHFSKRR